MERDLAEVLARLLSSSALRREYATDRWALAAALRLRESDVASFSSLDVDCLELQARTLIEKRLHEVRKLIPQACSLVGSVLPATFAIYAETSWPEGHLRHLEDARGFFRFLISRGVELPWEELHRTEFFLDRRRLSAMPVRSLGVGGASKPGLHVLYRNRRGRVREFAVWMGL